MSHTESHIRTASVVLSFCGRVRKKETKLFTQIIVAWARRNVFPVPVSLYNESAAHCSTASEISLVNRHPVCVCVSCVWCRVCVVCVSWWGGMSGGDGGVSEHYAPQIGTRGRKHNNNRPPNNRIDTRGG